MSKPMYRRLISAAVFITITATFALASPFASGPTRTNQNEHTFVPTKVALEASDEIPAPTF